MEVEDFASQLQLRLAEKNENSPTYRKAEGILASLLHATKTVYTLTCRFPTLHRLMLWIIKPWHYTSPQECSNCSNAPSRDSRNTNTTSMHIFCSSLSPSLKPHPTHSSKAASMDTSVMLQRLSWEGETTHLL